jgi:hypothetical protein
MMSAPLDAGIADAVNAPRGPFLTTVPLSFNLTLDALRRGRVTPAVGGGRLCERRYNLVLPAGIC